MEGCDTFDDQLISTYKAAVVAQQGGRQYSRCNDGYIVQKTAFEIELSNYDFSKNRRRVKRFYKWRYFMKRVSYSECLTLHQRRIQSFAKIVKIMREIES